LDPILTISREKESAHGLVCSQQKCHIQFRIVSVQIFVSQEVSKPYDLVRLGIKNLVFSTAWKHKSCIVWYCQSL